MSESFQKLKNITDSFAELDLQPEFNSSVYPNKNDLLLDDIINLVSENLIDVIYTKIINIDNTIKHIKWKNEPTQYIISFNKDYGAICVSQIKINGTTSNEQY